MTSISIAHINVRLEYPVNLAFYPANRRRERGSLLHREVYGLVCPSAWLLRFAGDAPLTVTLTRLHPKSVRALQDTNLDECMRPVQNAVAAALGLTIGSQKCKFTFAQEPAADYGLRIEVTCTGVER